MFPNVFLNSNTMFPHVIFFEEVVLNIFVLSRCLYLVGCLYLVKAASTPSKKKEEFMKIIMKNKITNDEELSTHCNDKLKRHIRKSSKEIFISNL